MKDDTERTRLASNPCSADDMPELGANDKSTDDATSNVAKDGSAFFIDDENATLIAPVNEDGTIAGDIDEDKTTLTGIVSDIDATVATISINAEQSSFSPGVGAGGFVVGSVLKERFKLERMLGEGGMGAVFLAVDQRKIEARYHDPYVAIKLIGGEFGKDPNAFISLQRETDKSQKLAHPNIITVHDFDRDGDVFFMTMEALKGQTLDALIVDGGLERRRASGYIEAISRAIAYAHQRDIVHSDIKPQNIFVTEDDIVKVLDFGIARALSSRGGVDDSANEVVGLTPAYASCEMFAGESPHPADDVYALGIIAYQLLSGRHPFERKKATLARDKGMRATKIKGLPSYQWKAISKALAFNRDERWQNADEFYRQFSGAGRLAKYMAMAMLCVILGFAAYLNFYTPPAGPDVPFEALPAETQQQVTESLQQGAMAQKFSDLNGALFYLNKAYLLHPRNPEVMAQLDGLVTVMIDGIATSAKGGDRPQQLQLLEELLKYESLTQNPRLLELRQSLID
ncbi:MAG: hypothetical protein ACI9BO_000025 [Zhongshania sp.]|jgi:hypothetical protein